MKRIGRVLHITSNKKAIIKAERIPRVGETVLDEEQRPIGTVFEIIGPVASPYIVVDVKLKDSQNIVNSLLYFSPSSKHEKRSRRRK